MTFNPQRAEALRSAIQGTAYRIKNYPEGDAKTLLTEHLALLQEAELIYLTDAFVGEGEDQDRRLGRVDLQSLRDDPPAELRETWAPGQRWQVRTLGGRNWGDFDGQPSWASHLEYRRHPDDIDQPKAGVTSQRGQIVDPDGVLARQMAADGRDAQPKPWYPDDSGEWVEVPEDCMTCPVPPKTEIDYLLRHERVSKRWGEDTREAGKLSWEWPSDTGPRIVAYKVVK